MANAPWWTVGWEAHRWESGDVYASRRQRMVSRGPYQAAVPAEISAAALAVGPEVEAESAEAAAAIVRFDARTASMLPARGARDSTPFAAVLLRTESVSSSQIEQITAGAKALALASIHERTGANARLVAQNVGAMRVAISGSDVIDGESVLRMHSTLLDGEGDWVGRWRSQQVWIGGGGSSPHTATFVPPHHSRVPAAMADLFGFCARNDIAPFTQAAIAHAQFETIHPFPDGNGRVGRALVHAMLAHAGLTRSTVVPVSAGLLSDTDTYFAALTAYRDGDVGPIVRRFSDAAFLALTNGQLLVDELVETRSAWHDKVVARRDSVVWSLLDDLLRQPAITTHHVEEEFGISQPAARRAIDLLVDAGVVVPTSAARRGRVWTCPEVITAMDAFAERSRRRFL